jgi:hypothetical protein
VTPPPNRTFAPGDLRFVYLHWTAGDYATRDAADRPVLHATHDLRQNMCDVRRGDGAYAAHTAGRNSYAIGVAICGMARATPSDFGAYPLRDDQIDLACATVAELCRAYRIGIDAGRVRTHAEAALEDGYFGDGPDERWDIARLAPAPEPLHPREAVATGDLLRARIRAAARAR